MSTISILLIQFLTTLGNKVKGNAVICYASLVTVIYTLFLVKRRSRMDQSGLQTQVAHIYFFVYIPWCPSALTSSSVMSHSILFSQATADSIEPSSQRCNKFQQQKYYQMLHIGVRLSQFIIFTNSSKIKCLPSWFLLHLYSYSVNLMLKEKALQMQKHFWRQGIFTHAKFCWL